MRSSDDVSRLPIRGRLLYVGPSLLEASRTSGGLDSYTLLARSSSGQPDLWLAVARTADGKLDVTWFSQPARTRANFGRQTRLGTAKLEPGTGRARPAAAPARESREPPQPVRGGRRRP